MNASTWLSTTRVLLCQSFRENGKPKHRTIAKFSKCAPEESAALPPTGFAGCLSVRPSWNWLGITRTQQIAEFFAFGWQQGFPRYSGDAWIVLWDAAIERLDC